MDKGYKLPTSLKEGIPKGHQESNKCQLEIIVRNHHSRWQGFFFKNIIPRVNVRECVVL